MYNTRVILCTAETKKKYFLFYGKFQSAILVMVIYRIRELSNDITNYFINKR